MKKIIIILSLFALTSCVHHGQERVYGCSPSQQKKVSEFIATSIKNANNMSDEEMEDVISQLERTAVHCNCSQYVVEVEYSDSRADILQRTDSLNYYRY
jgi:hypothetical protein